LKPLVCLLLLVRIARELLNERVLFEVEVRSET
jgi:hypothetical protein